MYTTTIRSIKQMNKIIATLLCAMLLLILAGCNFMSKVDDHEVTEAAAIDWSKQDPHFFYVNEQSSDWVEYVDEKVPYMDARYGGNTEAIRHYFSEVKDRMEKVSSACNDADKEVEDVYWTQEEQKNIFGNFFTASSWTDDSFTSQIPGWRNIYYPILYKDDHGIYIIGICEDGRMISVWRSGDGIGECKWDQRQVHHVCRDSPYLYYEKDQPGVHDYWEIHAEILYSGGEYTLVYEKNAHRLSIWHFGEKKYSFDVPMSVDGCALVNTDNWNYAVFAENEGDRLWVFKIYENMSVYDEECGGDWYCQTEE
jgi:hypothetical protein